MTDMAALGAATIREAIKNQVRALEDMLTIAAGLGVVDSDAAGRLREQLNAIESVTR